MNHNSKLSLAEITARPMPLSDKGKVAYWTLLQRTTDEFITTLPFFDGLPFEEKEVIRRARSRIRTKIKEAGKEMTRSAKVEALRQVLKLALGRRVTKIMARKAWKLLEMADTCITHVYAPDAYADFLAWSKSNTKEARLLIGRFFKHRERVAVADIAISKMRPEEPYYAKLPLFECSGELECNQLRYLSETSEKLVRRHGVDYWNIGRDGGGQHEIRFRIHRTLPDLACRLVRELGPTARNGGHIHINVQRDEETGKAVFFGLRRHLAWFRWMVLPNRRTHQRGYSSVVNTRADWNEALCQKFAALAANHFNDFGTIEVRLWPSTDKPDEWRFRAEFMQAMARWSVDQEWCDIAPSCITTEAGREDFMKFAAWAATHEPRVMRGLMGRLRRKANTTRDNRGALECRALVNLFDASGIRVPGMRRRAARPAPVAPTYVPTIPSFDPNDPWSEPNDPWSEPTIDEVPTPEPPRDYVPTLSPSDIEELLRATDIHTARPLPATYGVGYGWRRVPQSSVFDAFVGGDSGPYDPIHHDEVI